MEQRQKELEAEFEARFPALYKKAQAMRPVPALEGAPSPLLESPPPPFLPEGKPFKDVDWKGAAKEDDGYFDLRKAPLVEPLAGGLEKMRAAAGHLASAGDSSAPRTPLGHRQSEGYPEKRRMDVYADGYDHEDYDEIDPKSEGLRNDPGFQKAGRVPSAEMGTTRGAKTQDGGGGERSLKKASRKRSQLWERLRSAGNR